MRSKDYLEARDSDLSFLLIDELGDDEVAGVLHSSERTVQVSEVMMLQSCSTSISHHEGLEVVRAVGEVLQDMSGLQGHPVLWWGGLQQLGSVEMQGL